MSRTDSTEASSLVVLPFYTGIHSLEEAVKDPRASRLLWLEILVNDRIDWPARFDHPGLKEAYQKAATWYTHYQTLISTLIPRTPLPLTTESIDLRDYRTFAEALRFVSTHV